MAQLKPSPVVAALIPPPEGFTDLGVVAVDKRGRLTLIKPKDGALSQVYKQYVNPQGIIRLVPMVEAAVQEEPDAKN